MNLTDQFLESIDKVACAPFPDSVLRKAKRALLDYICVTVAGSASLRDKISAYFDFAEPECGSFPVIGCDKSAALKEAVFLNGLNGHALDYDDGTNAGIIHLGSPLFSVLLPLALKYKCSYDKLVRAVVLGYETSFTMALSIQPLHKSLGYHATGTCGTLGIAVAISYLLDFTAEQRKEAFAVACVSATGMLKVLDDGSELKPYNVAKTAVMGLTSAQMAMAGFHGHPDPLSGERGFLKMMTGTEEITLKTPIHNGTYAIEKTYTKPYAACRYLHPAIDASIDLKNQYEISPEDIEKIHIRTYFWAVNKHDHCVVPTSASAKMSIPYSVAAALFKGKAGLQEYTSDIIKDRYILELAERITVVDDPELTALFPDITSAVVNVTMKNGSQFETRVDMPKGEPENPLSDEEFYSRYLELMRFGGKSDAEADAVFNFVQNNNCDWNELFRLIK